MKISCCKKAFTLVEVTLALALSAFALMSVVGLVPIGLMNFRAAMDTTVVAQVTQALSSEAMQSDFNTLGTAMGGTRYFDDQGREVEDSSGIYHARPVVAQISPHLKLVLIQVARNPDGAIALELEAYDKNPSLQIWAASNPIPIDSRTIYVARTTPPRD